MDTWMIPISVDRLLRVRAGAALLFLFLEVFGGFDQCFDQTGQNRSRASRGSSWD